MNNIASPREASYSFPPSACWFASCLKHPLQITETVLVKQKCRWLFHVYLHICSIFDAHFKNCPSRSVCLLSLWYRVSLKNFKCRSHVRFQKSFVKHYKASIVASFLLLTLGINKVATWSLMVTSGSPSAMMILNSTASCYDGLKLNYILSLWQ